MRKLKTGLIVSALMMAITLTGCSKEGDIAKSSQVLAKVGDKEITMSYFERHMDKLPESVQRLAIEKTGKKALLEGMINREILYDEALRKDLDKDVEIKRRLEDIKKELITNALIQREIIDKLKIEDQEVEEYYRNNPDEFRNRKEIRISQIIVPDKKVAGEVMERLRAKADFAELVSKYSTDKPSAARKGDVGYFTYKQLPEVVRDSVFRLGAGEISQPYEIGGHYEIYRITDKRAVSYSFEQIKEPLKKQLLEKRFKESLKTMLDNLKKDVKVQINEGLLEK
jgi:peptidyl-prolyl cis-trans isomerase C